MFVNPTRITRLCCSIIGKIGIYFKHRKIPWQFMKPGYQPRTSSSIPCLMDHPHDRASLGHRDKDVAKPRRTGAGYPAARWQWWNGPIWPCLAPCGQVVFFSLFHVCFVFSTKTFLKLLMVSVMMVAQWWWRIGGFGMQIWIKGWPSRRARASGNDMAANYIVLMISIGSYINNKFIDPTIILNN